MFGCPMASFLDQHKTRGWASVALPPIAPRRAHDVEVDAGENRGKEFFLRDILTNGQYARAGGKGMCSSRLGNV